MSDDPEADKWRRLITGDANADRSGFDQLNEALKAVGQPSMTWEEYIALPPADEICGGRTN